MKTNDCKFYGNTVRDRLWMWGHHKEMAFHKATANGAELPGLPVDQADGCRIMGIPNNFVVRWGNMPSYPWGDYFEQFRGLKRFAFGIVDGGAGTLREKIDYALDFKKNFSNFSGVVMDDFFTNPDLHLEIGALRDVAAEVRANDLRLSVVLYSDQDGLKAEYKESIEVFDEVTYWFWSSDNIGTILDSARRCRDFVGGERDLLLGLYMWDFSKRAPVSASAMEEQLTYAWHLLESGVVTGLVFHPSFAADFDTPSVKLSREWIKKFGDRDLS